MMTLPEGFDVSLLVADFSSVSLPIVGILLLVAFGTLILRIFKLL